MKCSRRDLGLLLPALMAAGVTRLDAQQGAVARYFIVNIGRDDV